MKTEALTEEEIEVVESEVVALESMMTEVTIMK